MRRSSLILALALVLAVASPAFATDDEKFFLSHKWDLYKKLWKLPTGHTGPFTGPFTGPHHHFFHIGRKMLGEEAKANHVLHKEKLDKLKKLLPTGHGLPTGRFNSETLHAEHWHKETLDKLKKLLPTGYWAWNAEDQDAEGQFFLPKNKINKLKKLLPTGHWLWDPEVQSLETTDDKTFFLHKHLLPTGLFTGAFTGPWWKP